MKVIGKRGRKQKWIKRFNCGQCREKLGIEESDLYVANTAVAYAGETWDPRLRFECAVCHSENDVTDRVPSGIQHRLFETARKKMV